MSRGFSAAGAPLPPEEEGGKEAEKGGGISQTPAVG